MGLTIDCNLPAPYIAGSWRPNSCNSASALIRAIEMITTYLCEEVVPPNVSNNSFRAVVEGTDSSLFNAEFDGGTPADEALVVEGANFWFTVDGGANWDIVLSNTFQVAAAADFANPDLPTDAELAALFPQSLPARDAIVLYNRIFDKVFFFTTNFGATWTYSPSQSFRIAEPGGFADPDNPLDVEFNAFFFKQDSMEHSLIFHTHNNTFYYAGSTNNWFPIEYVDVAGDTMTGTLVINRSETDYAFGNFAALDANATHTITANNNNEPTGVDSTTNFVTGAFDSTGTAYGVKGQAVVTTSASGSLYQAVGLYSKVTVSGAGNLDYISSILVDAPSVSGGTSIIEAYGIYVTSVTGASNPLKNFAISTEAGGGKIYLGDWTQIDGSRDQIQLEIFGHSTQTSVIFRVAKDNNTTCVTVDNNQKLYVGGEVEIDGALNHDGTTVGFYGVAPAAQSATYSGITNVSTDRAYDANSTTLDEIADVLGTLIADLRLTGIIG